MDRAEQAAAMSDPVTSRPVTSCELQSKDSLLQIVTKEIFSRIKAKEYGKNATAAFVFALLSSVRFNVFYSLL